MINRKPLNDSLAAVKKAFPKAKPTLGMILGSGLSDIAESFTPLGVLSYEKIPGLGKAGVAGHAGRLVWGKSAGIETFIFQGRRHVYEGVGWEAVATPLFLLKSLGAKAVFLTNAAGGTNPKWKPGDLMIIDDHINLMGVTPLLGKHDPFWGPRFPDQSFIYDRKLRAALSRAGKRPRSPCATASISRAPVRPTRRPPNPRVAHARRRCRRHVHRARGHAGQRLRPARRRPLVHHQHGRRHSQPGPDPYGSLRDLAEGHGQHEKTHPPVLEGTGEGEILGSEYLTPRRKVAKMDENEIGKIAVDSAVQIHRELGPACWKLSMKSF
jgi:hypothetical protein